MVFPPFRIGGSARKYLRIRFRCFIDLQTLYQKEVPAVNEKTGQIPRKTTSFAIENDKKTKIYLHYYANLRKIQKKDTAYRTEMSENSGEWGPLAVPGYARRGRTGNPRGKEGLSCCWN